MEKTRAIAVVLALSMAFCLVLAPLTQACEIIIDNGDPGTSSTGTWLTSGGEDPYGQNKSVFSNQAGATYTFETAVTGCYKVSLWWTYWPNRCTSVPVEIYDGSNPLDTVYVDQQHCGEWNVLGTYRFSGTAKVVINSEGSCTTCADAVKFAPVPDDRCPAVPAPVAKTGQATCYNGTEIDCWGTGQDGDWQKGVAWPNPRFTDNGNGTVTDNLTGLIWLKNANCLGLKAWAQALNDCNTLAHGDCDLTDGSSAGDWRLANVKELQSLIHYGFVEPALADTAGTGQWSDDDPFSDVPCNAFWSSTPLKDYVDYAFVVDVCYGWVGNLAEKSDYYYAWPVRGGR